MRMIVGFELTKVLFTEGWSCKRNEVSRNEECGK